MKAQTRYFKRFPAVLGSCGPRGALLNKPTAAPSLYGCLVAVVLLVVLLVAPAQADKAPQQPDPTTSPETQNQPADLPGELPEPIIPERKLQFEVIDELAEQKINAEQWNAYPGLREMRYQGTATFVVWFPSDEQLGMPVHLRPGGYGMVPFRLFRTFWQSRVPRSRPSFADGFSPIGGRAGRGVAGPSFGRTMRRDMAEGFFDQVLKIIPEDRQPVDGVIAGLRRPRPFVSYKDAYPADRNAESLGIKLSVCAPTAERAEELLRGAITILDRGLCRWAQLECRRQTKSKLQPLAKWRTELKQLEAKLATLPDHVARLESLQDVSEPETLRELKTQQRLLSVDVEGLEAQVKTCDKYLSKFLKSTEDRHRSQIEELEKLKVTAEIELAGMAARKKAIADMIAGAQQLVHSKGELAAAQSHKVRLEDSVQNTTQAVQMWKTLYHANAPYSIDGKIVIQPVQWTVVEK